MQVALVLLMGPGGHRASAGARRLLILHTPPLPEAGLAQPSKASFWHLLFLGDSWKTLPSVLTMFWVFRLVCGSRRRLPGLERSWASPHWMSPRGPSCSDPL